MRNRPILWRMLALLMAMGLIAAACGDSGDDAAPATTAAAGDSGGGESEAPAEMVDVKLQLQWFTQAQFAGYFAAVDQGYYEDLGLNVDILEGGVDIVPQTQLDSGAVDFAIAWVPKALVSIEEGAKIVDIGQVFQRSGTLQVSFADSGITKVEDLKGKTVGNWGFGNEFELLAGLRKAGLDPESDVTLVQQNFDMLALLNREIDAAQAMIYNEYAQVLETVNPDTGELYQPEDLSVINWNDVGTAMLQDAIWADADRLESDPAYRDTAVKFVQASLKGWAFCRDNFDQCVDIVLQNAPTLGKSHQAWQLNEINQLIWPSPNGAGIMDKSLWDQTKDVAISEQIVSSASDDSFRTDIAEEAIANLEAEGIDVKGTGYSPTTVTLNEGGS
ncbi:MAG TPA: ABC transporter substrate-binding protein [Acidimicrobiales bacterium]|nr:ABC transporter substrate-binding protein [Acidimicrobiales bacterium]